MKKKPKGMNLLMCRYCDELLKVSLHMNVENEVKICGKDENGFGLYNDTFIGISHDKEMPFSYIRHIVDLKCDSKNCTASSVFPINNCPMCGKRIIPEKVAKRTRDYLPLKSPQQMNAERLKRIEEVKTTKNFYNQCMDKGIIVPKYKTREFYLNKLEESEKGE